MDLSLGIKPRASFKVEKIIAISSEGSCKVQWAPVWVSRFHLVGCEHLIHEFLQQSERETLSRLAEGKLPQVNKDLSLFQLDINSSGNICLGPLVRTLATEEQEKEHDNEMAFTSEGVEM